MGETTGLGEVDKQVPLAKQIWKTLEDSKDRKLISWERKQKQEDILERLPTNLEYQIKNFISDKKPAEFGDGIAGEMFEHLVRADSHICPEDETRIAQIVRNIMKSPSKNHLEEYGIGESVRQPDFTHMNQEEQFDRAVEVKARQIGPRAIDQLKRFKENLTKVVNILQGLKENNKQVLENHGLTEIANSPKKLEVAENFAVTLAVPYGTYEGISGLLIDEKSFKHDNDAIEDAVETLESCTIIESPFSRKDLGIITDCVLNWLQQQNPGAESPKVAQ